MKGKTHELKIHRYYYEAVKEGKKTFEIRKDDRGFEEGDRVKFKDAKTLEPLEGEWEISFVLRHDTEYGLKRGFCVFGLKEVGE